MAKIKYLPKQKLYPSFGRAENNTAYIRKDLPKPVKEFVKDHELYHLKDNANNWVIREIKANSYSALRHPLGFIITIIMSLQLYRLKFYLNKIKEKQ